MTEYRSAFYPDHALESFDVQRTARAAGDWGGYYGRAVWRGPRGATAATYCGCLHFDPGSALSCIKRWHEVRMPGSGEIAVPDVIEGAAAPEDVVRANMRAAGFPVGSAADARAIRAQAEQWAQDFAAASRAEDGIVIDCPRSGGRGTRASVMITREPTSASLVSAVSPEDAAEEPADAEDRGAGAIIGLAVPGVLGGWYLGCITCHGEIDKADSGMCRPCREDAAWQEQQQRASQEPEED